MKAAVGVRVACITTLSLFRTQDWSKTFMQSLFFRGTVAHVMENSTHRGINSPMRLQKGREIITLKQGTKILRGEELGWGGYQ